MKPSGVLEKIDSKLLWGACWPIAKKVDYYLHISPTEIAIKLMMVSAIMAIFDSIANHAAWGGLSMRVMDITITLLIIMIRAWDIYTLSVIEKKWRERPNMMPLEMVRYILPFNRIMYLLIGFMMLLPLDIVSSVGRSGGSVLSFIWHFLPRIWFETAGVAYYFAALPRPPAKRKEYKMPEFTGFRTPAIAGSK